MIAIVNVDKNLRPSGTHDYELRINRKVVARFTHEREHGLATCLQLAAVAAQDPRRQEVLDDEAFLAACLSGAEMKR
jgi:hypothetical protein